MKDQRSLQNASTAIQRLLYENPLYHWISEGEKNLNVMVIGYDAYAAKFIDICLQAGQMKDHDLYITVVSENPEKARADYLKSRPALPLFVDLENSSKINDDVYAVLHFTAVPKNPHALCASDAGQYRQIVEEIMLVSSGGERVHYLFLSMGDDACRRRLTGTFAETAQILENKCCINYIQESPSDEALPKQALSCRPVSITESSAPQTGHDALEEMAFRTHLLWSGMENIDMQKAREEFSRPYYHDSSMSYALSIGYKLQSFGITGSNADETAAEFNRRILQQKDTDETCRKIFDQMAALEHRRWVLEKVTNGWQAPPFINGEMDFSYCIETGSIKDEARKYHPCIVKSTAAAPLKDSAYVKDRHEKWDHPGKGEEDLDALDQVSLALHRSFYQYTQNFRHSDPMAQGEAAQIGLLLQNAGEAVQLEYRRYCLCLRNILNGEAGYSRQYDAYEKKFSDTINAAGSLSSSAKKSIQEHIKNIRLQFFPVIEYSLYRNYKELNAVLQESLPFILTWHSSCHLALALNPASDTGGESNAMFQNAASAVIIHPEEITYLCYVDHASDFGLLRKKLLALDNYFQHRKMNCRLHLQILLPEGMEERHDTLQKMLAGVQKKIGLDAVINPCQNEKQAAALAVSLLQENHVDLFDGSCTLFPSNRQNADFIRLVTDQLPYFEFDRTRKRFYNDSRCDYLHYITDHSYMRIEDMFAMMNASDRRFHYPDFAGEYESLWNIYTGKSTGVQFWKGVGCWNNLCGQLEDYHRSRPDRLSVEKLPLHTEKYRSADYLKILEALQKKGYIRNLSMDQKLISFRYKAEKFRDLLTKAGEILEVYTYFEACRTGYFDDIASSYEFKWETGNVTNELDCVLTKGFCSIIVECKAQMELKQDFYYKLDSLGSRFGIGTKKVLIANTYINTPRLNEINELQKTRGKQMGIITISDENDIQNIGKTLRKIMEDMI